MNTSYIVPSTNRHPNNYYSAKQHLSNRDGKMRKQSNQNGFQSWFPIFIIFSCSPDFVECRDGVTLFRCRSRQIMMQSIDYWLRSDYLYSDTLRREWQRWCPRSDYDDVAATMTKRVDAPSAGLIASLACNSIMHVSFRLPHFSRFCRCAKNLKMMSPRR